TTRPETMLGDTAVAVNPKDDRYQGMIGKMLKLPETNREVPIIADAFVDKSFGTGAVKVTPAHDPNDFQMGERHNLEKMNIMNEDGTMNHLAGADYEGMDRYECREALVEALKQKKNLIKIEEHQHAVGHCYRCHTVIEPYLSDQWFVKMKPLASIAIKATKKGKVKFHPDRWESFYLQWLENVRDWCISRQIWWGHRIPVWYCENKDCKPIVSKIEPTKCPKCGSVNLKQEEDVLDTWFSSALWPFSTLGWPEKTKTLKKFYPTSVLSTDRGIIFFWVARMVMIGLYDMNDVPFKDVYIHGTILDEVGRKMSKSLGNGIDPLDIIEKYGADAMRFSLISLSAEGQDIKLSEQKFEMGRNFCNKLWNAARFAMMNLENYDGNEDSESNLSIVDKWIYNRFQVASNGINEALDNFKLNESANIIYKFVWNEFCDWYLEFIKPIMSNDADPKQRHATQWNLARILDGILRMAHPVMPFITEEIWQQLSNVVPTCGHAVVKSLMLQEYPKSAKKPEFADEALELELVKDIIAAIRNIRGEHDVKPSQKIEAKVVSKDNKSREILNKNQSFIISQAKLEKFELLNSIDRNIPAATALVNDVEVFIPFAGLIDIEAEKDRLTKEIAKAEKECEIFGKKLSNESFVDRAPKEVVEKEKAKLSEAETRRAKLKESLEKLEII
ncbi:valine--tRNA ligase, partial [bacterium]|nr:valine--tRNA ligase [bacterium]